MVILSVVMIFTTQLRMKSGISIFFFNDTATTEIYTLSLHDALPIYSPRGPYRAHHASESLQSRWHRLRSEEHTSELQSRLHLVCRLLLEKKKTKRRPPTSTSLLLQRRHSASSGWIGAIMLLTRRASR